MNILKVSWLKWPTEREDESGNMRLGMLFDINSCTEQTLWGSALFTHCEQNLFAHFLTLTLPLPGHCNQIQREKSHWGKYSLCHHRRSSQKSNPKPAPAPAMSLLAPVLPVVWLPLNTPNHRTALFTFQVLKQHDKHWAVWIVK